MNIQEIESATRIAWPAIEEIELEGGTLRYASGVSRRSNALIPKVSGRFCPQQLISETERFYSAKGQDAVIKVLITEKANCAFGKLDMLLEEVKYQKQAPTAVLGLQLNQDPGLKLSKTGFHIIESTKDDWVAAWQAVRMFNPVRYNSHRQLLRRISGIVYCLVMHDDHLNPCATGMAVLNKKTLGIFGIATSKKYHGQGLASQIISELLRWGRLRGAGFAFLQVEERNLPALALYKKFGFTQQYSYWYRVKEMAEGRVIAP